MTKRILPLLLYSVMLLILVPSAPAYAQVLTGMTSKVDYDNTDPNRYTIDVDLVNQVISVYDNYSGATMIQGLCTTGNDENPTGSGTFKIGELKERFGYFVAYGQYAQYWTQVVRGVYIHSVMYDSKTNLSSMSRSAYNNLGSRKSHGCIRVLPEVAQWIFYNCPPGTTCNIVKNRAANTTLVSTLKSKMASYSNYKQPTDTKTDPVIIPAAIRYNNVPLRTGFSETRDTTITTLNANDKVLLLQIGSSWCKVKTPAGKMGYVKSAYILCYPDDTAQTASTYTSTRKTYIYESMDKNSKQLQTIPSGSVITVTSISGKYWYQGSYNGVSGYLRKKYISYDTAYVYPEANVISTTDSTGTVAATATSAHIKDGIFANFRSAPTTSAAVISVLPSGTVVSIISISGNWYYCQVNGVYGYLHKACIA